MALTHPQRVDRLVLIDGLPDHVRERLASPLMQRAVNTRVPVWLARLGNWLFPSTGTEAVLKEIVFDHALTDARRPRSIQPKSTASKPHRAAAVDQRQSAFMGTTLCDQASRNPPLHADSLG